ncbi:unnamed protein product, partial [Brenthis ino]
MVGKDPSFALVNSRMLPVFILCASFISTVLLEDVVSKNVTLKSTSEVIPTSPLPVNVQRRTENSVKSKPQVARPLRINSKIGSENRFPTSCPQADILLKILNLLTKSLPSSVIEPEKFKDVVSDINVLLGKAPVNPAFFGLHNKFKILQDELEKILNEGKRDTISYEPNENKLKAKISLEYDVPGKCEEVLNVVINFLNNAYKEKFRNCFASGKCLVNDLPQIQYGITEQTKQPTLLDQLIQESQSNNPYPHSNNLLDQSLKEYPTYNTHLPGLKQETKEENIYDIINLQNNYKPSLPKPAIALENMLNLIKPQDGSELDRSVHSLTQPYSKFLIDKSIQEPDVNYIPTQYIDSALNIPMTGSNMDQESPNISVEKLRSKYDQTGNNSDGKINNEILNLSGNLIAPMPNVVVQPFDNLLKVGNEMVPSNILNNPYYKLPTDSVTPDIQNLLSVKGTTNKQPSFDYSSVLHQLLQNPALNNVYYPSTNHGINDLINLKYLQQSQIVPNKIAEAYAPYINTYVRSDNLYLPHDINNQHAQLTNLIQSGVSNSVKLNEVANRNGVVELTYMLKQPKPAIEPLYYAKYKMPYNTFLYSVQDLLNKKPHLGQYPKQLYQELLMKSNVTEVSDELKNLQHDELTKLMSNNGILIAAKVIQGNKEISESLSNVLQTLNSTPQLPKASNLSAAKLFNSLLYYSPKSLIGIQKRLGLNPNDGYSYLPYNAQSRYQTKYLINSGSKVLNPNYSTFYGVPSVKYAYLVNKNVAPLNIQNYLQSYLSGNSRVVKSN